MTEVNSVTGSGVTTEELFERNRTWAAAMVAKD